MTEPARTLRRSAGSRPETGPQPVRRLVLLLRDHAVSLGFTPRGIEHSRVRGSGSCYLSFDDARGRRWIMRVANHLPPRQTGREKPHIELVSWDGTSGELAGKALLDRVAAGLVEWFDAALTVRSKRPNASRKGKRRGEARR